MKKVLAFDIDQTLNIAKTPIPDDIADLLIKCLDRFQICPVSGQKYEQFLIQIVDRLVDRHVDPKKLANLHLFVAQGTQYYRYDSATNGNDGTTYDPSNWQRVYDFPFTPEQVAEASQAIEQAAKELGFWEEDKLAPGDIIIEDRHSLVCFSALGQKADIEAKYAWDPDCTKRQKIVARAMELAPNYFYEIGGATSINASIPGTNKSFGIKHLMEELSVEKSDILYFGDMTQPGGNDYPVVEMGIDTITVRSHEDTAYALQGILGVIGAIA